MLDKAECKGGELIAIYHSEGRIANDGEGWNHEFHIRDHLGNTHVIFSDRNGDGSITQSEEDSELLEEAHYYPFGLRMEGPWITRETDDRNEHNFYKGKELYDQGFDTDGGGEKNYIVGLYEYGARFYDPSLGRFTGVDPIADQTVSWSPYSYTYNNPSRYTDPTGMKPDTTRVQGSDGEFQITGTSSRTNMWIFNTGITVVKDNKTDDVVFGQVSDMWDDEEQGGYVIYANGQGVLDAAQGENSSTVIHFPYFPGNYNTLIGDIADFLSTLHQLNVDKFLFSKEWVNGHGYFSSDQEENTEYTNAEVTNYEDSLILIRKNKYRSNETVILNSQKSKGVLTFGKRIVRSEN